MVDGDRDRDTDGHGGGSGERDRACEQVRIGLAAYAFGALDACDWRVVTGHLAGCEPCRREHADYGDLMTLMATVLPWEIEPGTPGTGPGPGGALRAVRRGSSAAG